MERVLGAAAAVMGVVVLFNLRRFVDSSARSSREIFGVELPRGSRRARANAIWTRTVTIVVATAMIVVGLVTAVAPA